MKCWRDERADTDRDLNTGSEALRNVSQEYLDEDVPRLIPTTYENEEGETVHVEAEVGIESGTVGFVRAFVNELRVRSTVSWRHLQTCPFTTQSRINGTAYLSGLLFRNLRLMNFEVSGLQSESVSTTSLSSRQETQLLCDSRTNPM